MAEMTDESSPPEQHTVGHVAHQLAFYRRFQRGFELGLVADVVLDCAVLHPVAFVPSFKLAILAPQVVSRRKVSTLLQTGTSAFISEAT